MTKQLEKTTKPVPDEWIRVVLFDGKGGARLLAADEVPVELPAKAFLLIEGSGRSKEFREWLAAQIGADSTELLCGERAQPRFSIVDDKAIVHLAVPREVAEHGSSADGERQVMALWIEARRVIAVHEVKSLDIVSLDKWAASRHAPLSPIDVVARLGLRSADRIEPLIERIGDQLDRIEQGIFTEAASAARQKLSATRRTIIGLRRLIWPPRDALDTLEIEDLSFITARDRTRLREATGRLERLGAELQSLSERAVLVHEQILDYRAEQMNRIILVLTAVTVILMPMTVISGILGMNVAGIPFAGEPWAFWIVLVLMGGIGFGLYLFMRLRKWL
jgi:zinc transporter